MTDILKITLVLIIIVFLLKKRWNLGLVMALSSIILAFMYLLSPFKFWNAFYTATTDITTISLVVALTLIRIFENVMRKNGIMQQMMDSFRGMVMNRRILMASMPALIGLLPSMGGALFSAPMVEEASKGINISPEKKAFVNYIFRHPWEFILPLYPGVILASAITSYSLRDLILTNIPYALCLLIGGTVWGLSGIGMQKEGFSWDIVLIILGVMTFKAVLNYSGAVTNISNFFTTEGIPVLPLLFFLPFIYGLLTGLTVAFVGSTFPIILGLENANHIGAISFAFASGYAGVLLSPVHLCLVLTREYFKAAMSGIYKKIIKVCILIILVAVAEYSILSRYYLAR
ncbi:MAG: DUF401 family protein [Nitrospirae bacterium]|nr:DUF401 family protein [Nitrospirota bacterium]